MNTCQDCGKEFDLTNNPVRLPSELFKYIKYCDECRKKRYGSGWNE